MNYREAWKELKGYITTAKNDLIQLASINLDDRERLLSKASGVDAINEYIRQLETSLDKIMTTEEFEQYKEQHKETIEKVIKNAPCQNYKGHEFNTICFKDGTADEIFIPILQDELNERLKEATTIIFDLIASEDEKAKESSLRNARKFLKDKS